MLSTEKSRKKADAMRRIFLERFNEYKDLKSSQFVHDCYKEFMEETKASISTAKVYYNMIMNDLEYILPTGHLIIDSIADSQSQNSKLERLTKQMEDELDDLQEQIDSIKGDSLTEDEHKRRRSLIYAKANLREQYLKTIQTQTMVGKTITDVVGKVMKTNTDNQKNNILVQKNNIMQGMSEGFSYEEIQSQMLQFSAACKAITSKQNKAIPANFQVKVMEAEPNANTQD